MVINNRSGAWHLDDVLRLLAELLEAKGIVDSLSNGPEEEYGPKVLDTIIEQDEIRIRVQGGQTFILTGREVGE